MRVWRRVAEAAQAGDLRRDERGDASAMETAGTVHAPLRTPSDRVVRVSTMSNEAAAELLTEYTEAVWNDGDLDVVSDYFAPDVVIHDVPATEEYRGVDEFCAWVEQVRTAFPDFHVDTEETLVDDGRLVSRWTASGTDEGGITAFGMEPSNRHAEWSGITMYAVEDGAITEAWWYYDMLGILAQTGALPPEMTE